MFKLKNLGLLPGMGKIKIPGLGAIGSAVKGVKGNVKVPGTNLNLKPLPKPVAQKVANMKIPPGATININGMKVTNPAPPQPPVSSSCTQWDESKGMTSWPTLAKSEIKTKIGLSPGVVTFALDVDFGTLINDPSSLWKGALNGHPAMKNYKYYIIAGWSKGRHMKVYWSNDLATAKQIDKILASKPDMPPAPPPITLSMNAALVNKDVEAALKKIGFSIRGLHMLLDFQGMAQQGKFNSRPLHTSRGKVWLGPWSGVFDRYQDGTNSYTGLWWCLKGGKTRSSHESKMQRSADTQDMHPAQWHWFHVRRTPWKHQGLTQYSGETGPPWYWPSAHEGGRDHARRGKGSGSLSIHPKRDTYFGIIMNRWAMGGEGWKIIASDSKLKKIFKVKPGFKLEFQPELDISKYGSFERLTYGFCGSPGGRAGAVTGLAATPKPVAPTATTTITSTSSSGGVNKTMSRSVPK